MQGLALFALLPILAQAPPAPGVNAQISVDISGASTRLVVTAPRPLAWRVGAAPTGLAAERT